jgi:hypothetical protein
MDEPLVVVQEPMNGADLYRKLAAEHSDLMKGASSPFLRMYHQRIVERYLLHAEDALGQVRPTALARPLRRKTFQRERTRPPDARPNRGSILMSPVFNELLLFGWLEGLQGLGLRHRWTSGCRGAPCGKHTARPGRH